MTSCTKIDELRKVIASRLDGYRLSHVLSTEEEAAKITAVYMPKKVTEARISALLHDITKGYDNERQLKILSDFGTSIDEVAKHSPKVFHSLTAALLIPTEFPEFATDEIVCSVRNHTTGTADMSIFDCIIYLADYIEPTRTFDDCISLRRYFWEGLKNCSCEKERLLHLYKTMVMSFDLTIKNLIDEQCVIAPDTFSARNAFLMKISEESENE